MDGIDHDGDGQSTRQEYIADTKPLDKNSVFRVGSIDASRRLATTRWPTSSSRRYALLQPDDLVTWTPVANYEDVVGTGLPMTFTDSIDLPKKRFYKVRARIP